MYELQSGITFIRHVILICMLETSFIKNSENGKEKTIVLSLWSKSILTKASFPGQRFFWKPFSRSYLKHLWNIFHEMICLFAHSKVWHSFDFSFFYEKPINYVNICGGERQGCCTPSPLPRCSTACRRNRSWAGPLGPPRAEPTCRGGSSTVDTRHKAARRLNL